MQLLLDRPDELRGAKGAAVLDIYDGEAEETVGDLGVGRGVLRAQARLRPGDDGDCRKAIPGLSNSPIRD
jgi:hypothetical protein